MKSSTVPIFCAICLAAMVAAGSSHWWSVNQFVTAFHAGMVPSPTTHSITSVKKTEPVVAVAQSASPLAPSSEQKNFYDGLLKQMNTLQDQNRDLLGQMAETNRDVMNLGFRVDTHSTQFRPLDVSESQSENSLGDASVLPPVPRADPVFPLENE